MNAQSPRLEAASYRDPGGKVFEDNSRIYRAIFPAAEAEFVTVWSSGFLQSLTDRGWLVPAAWVEPPTPELELLGAQVWLEHPRLGFVSYPYEWCFEALKSAALLHLDIQLEALEHDIKLIDASAYNVQFVGHRPIFIDHLSFRPYREGEFWTAHSQFLDQFLNPLLLWSFLGVSHNAWFRGSLEGIPTAELNRLLPWRRKLSFNVLLNVTLPARFQVRASSKGDSALKAVKQSSLPRTGHRAMVQRLRNWIARLHPRRDTDTTWQRYEEFRTYGTAELDAKRQFVEEFVAAVAPKQLIDLGCNTGEFSELALKAGSQEAIGFDVDHGALDLAFRRAREQELAFLPLFLDAANPSPGQGWSGMERKNLQSRCRADALLALAFVHHLAIARNVPLAEVIGWLTALAPQGVMEFVPKSDPTVQIMLRLRDDIFEDYTEANFLRSLSDRARIVKQSRVTDSRRLLVWYERI